MNKRLIAAVLVGSLGGFIFGFDLGALSAATQSLKAQFLLSPWAFGLTISISIWGTVCGSILSGRLADKIDRRTLIAWCAFVYAVGATGIALPIPPSWFLALAMRFLCGIAIGGFTVGCPLYLSEISPVALRGRVVGVFQVQVGVGVIAAFAIGTASAHFAQLASTWKLVLGLGVFPALALLFLVRLLPKVNAPVTAGDSARNSTGFRFQEHVHAQPFFVRGNMRLILLATSIAVFNQLSGVNVLLLYMLQILASGGVDFLLGHRYTVWISGLSLATTMIGTFFVDRVGRRPLLVLGAVGMAGCLIALGLAIPRHFSPATYLWMLVAYNVFFALSQGAVVWVYLSELFPPGLRGAGQGYGSTIHWIANAALISIFPSMQHASSVSFFYIFAAMMVMQIIVIWLWYPETSGTELGSFASAGQGRLH